MAPKAVSVLFLLSVRKDMFLKKLKKEERISLFGK
jgi:hypothetical protein